jgi:NAD(P)H-binding
MMSSKQFSFSVLSSILTIWIWFTTNKCLFENSVWGVWRVDALMASASNSATSSTTTIPRSHHVLVTGASGRTGQLVFGLLLDDPRFEPKALVRSPRSAKKLMKQVPKTRLDQIVISDVTTLLQNDEKNGSEDSNQIPPGLNGLDRMVVCTSAVPTISKISLLKALITAPFNLLRGKKAVDFRRLRFVWKYGHYPEKIDYHGQISQIELAKKLSIKEIVLVGSMGGTDPSNFLNQVGKNQDGSGHGDILLWKRKAEKHLINSGLDYVIIHPGGLIDTPPGQEEYVLDVNDKLVNNKKRSISRADVAQLCVAALALDPSEIKCVNCPNDGIKNNDNSDGAGMTPSFLNKAISEKTQGRKQISLDCVTQAPENGQTVRNADQALRQFLMDPKVYDYSL